MHTNLVPQLILDQHRSGVASGQFEAVCLFVDISGFTRVTNTLIQQGSEAAEAMADVMVNVFEPLVDAVYAQGGFISTFAGDAFTALFPQTGASPVSVCQRGLATEIRIQRHMSAHPIQETPYGRFPFAIKQGLGMGSVEWEIITSSQEDQPAVYYFRGEAIDRAVSAEHQAQPGNIILAPATHKLLEGQIKTLPVSEDGYVRFLTEVVDLPQPHGLPAACILPGQAAFVPQVILNKQGHGEFRPVVSMFINLHSSPRTEDLPGLMKDVFALLSVYGGYLGRLDFGDKGATLLLFWGMPTSTENDVDRALHFIDELSGCSPCDLKAGITYRTLYAGLAGSARRGEYTAYGGGVSYAARLMRKAPWWNIWLDEQVVQSADGREFAFRQVGDYPFKGFDLPQPVYTLAERQDWDADGFFQGELVGRQAELAHLRDFIAPILTEGRHRWAGILSVEGEAGLGKSRLVTEFLLSLPQQIAATGEMTVIPQWILCQVDQTIRRPLNPFRYWLRDYFRQSSVQTEVRNKLVFNRRLEHCMAAVPDESLRETLEQGRSFLGALVDLYWDHSLYSQLEPQQRSEWTVTTLKALILAESLLQPLIISLEDAQWLDSESIAFIERLVRQIEAYPIALLATARPRVENTPLFGEVPYQCLQLPLINQTELTQLAEVILGGPVGGEILDTLDLQAEGNPFFVEQILQYLKASGLIERRNGCWQGVNLSERSVLPDDVRALFISRLDQLPPEIQSVVQTAAILGREFEVQVLSHMLPDDSALPDQLKDAEAHTIWSPLSQERYMFKHALLRDAAYAMQLRAQRRELHRRAAEALESLFAANLNPPYDEIAHHYEAAYQQGLTDVRSQTVAYLQAAGEQAAANYENDQAIDSFSRALAILPEEYSLTRYGLLLGREAVYALQGRREEQRQDLSTLAAIAQVEQRPEQQSQIALRQSSLARVTGDYPGAISAAQFAIGQSQIAGDVIAEAKAQLEWGEVLLIQGEYADAREHSGLALDLAQAVGQRTIEANVFANLGLVARYQGDYPTAQEYFRESLKVARAVGNRRGEGRALVALGNIARYQGDYPAAQEYFQQSLVIAHEIGDREGEGRALNRLAMIAGYQGDYHSARAFFQRSLSIRRAIGDCRGEAYTLCDLGVLTWYHGDYPTASMYFQQSLINARAIGDSLCEGHALANLGNIANAQQDYPAAREYYQQSLDIRQAIGDREGTGFALMGLGDTLGALGHVEEAISTLQESLVISRELEHQPLHMETLTILAIVYLMHGDARKALSTISEVLVFLDAGGNFDGTEYELRNFMLCYQVLQANNDPQATEILQMAYKALLDRANQIADDQTRSIFLQNIPWHQDILTVASERRISDKSNLSKAANISSIDNN